MPNSIVDIIMFQESDGFSSGTTMFYPFDRGAVLGRFNNVSVPNSGSRCRVCNGSIVDPD